MAGPYGSSFVREMGCSAAELRAWLPGASPGCSLDWEGESARIELPGGALRLHWQVLEPRRIALIVLPRLRVSFDFGSTPEAARQVYMRHFDLYTQRGGG